MALDIETDLPLKKLWNNLQIPKGTERTLEDESIVCKQIEAATNEVYTSSSIRETDQSFSKST